PRATWFPPRAERALSRHCPAGSDEWPNFRRSAAWRFPAVPLSLPHQNEFGHLLTVGVHVQLVSGRVDPECRAIFRYGNFSRAIHHHKSRVLRFGGIQNLADVHVSMALRAALVTVDG